MTLTRWVWLAGLVLGQAAAALGGDDLETVEKKIAEAWNKHRSISAKVALVNRILLMGENRESTGSGTYEFIKDGDRLRSRLELKSKMTHKVGEEERVIEQQMTMVSDGETAQTLYEAFGKKQVFKTKVEPYLTGEPKARLEQLRKVNDLKLLPEDTVDGRKVYVIEATPKLPPQQATPDKSMRQQIYFDQETGFLVKLVGLDAEGKPITTMTYSEIKIDVPIDPDRFRLKIPEDAEVVDEDTPLP